MTYTKLTIRIELIINNDVYYIIGTLSPRLHRNLPKANSDATLGKSSLGRAMESSFLQSTTSWDILYGHLLGWKKRQKRLGIIFLLQI